MSSESLAKLVEGYQKFKEEYLRNHSDEYRHSASLEQNPRTMVIACSDSRLNPAILTNTGLGEIFTVRNVANLVPSYEEDKDTHHGTSAALEYAVCNLQVENIIILGHAGCGGIRALMEGTTSEQTDKFSFIQPWMEIASTAKEAIIEKYSDATLDEQAAHCEKKALLVSLNNLKTFPWINSAIDEGALDIHAWYFNIKTGNIEQYNTSKDCFSPLNADKS